MCTETSHRGGGRARTVPLVNGEGTRPERYLESNTHSEIKAIQNIQMSHPLSMATGRGYYGYIIQLSKKLCFNSNEYRFIYIFTHAIDR
jgi:hypothetical protein